MLVDYKVLEVKVEVLDRAITLHILTDKWKTTIKVGSPIFMSNSSSWVSSTVWSPPPSGLEPVEIYTKHAPAGNPKSFMWSRYIDVQLLPVDEPKQALITVSTCDIKTTGLPVFNFRLSSSFLLDIDLISLDHEVTFDDMMESLKQ